ncbi:MAG: alanine racemase [Acidimicrobiia bacterium]
MDTVGRSGSEGARAEGVSIADQVVACEIPSEMDTPAIVIDRDRLDRNIRTMARALGGVMLRPHFKSHKMLAVARRQIDAGAVGLTCATLGEAEVLVDGGLTDVFVAYPLMGRAEKARRLRDLTERSYLRIGVESAAAAQWAGAAVRGARRPLEVLVEIDCGYGRTGVTPRAAAAVAAAAEGAGLSVVGAFTHGGQAYDGRNPDGALRAAECEERVLAEAVEVLRHEGHDAVVASAGSTPTARLSATGAVTEERPGTYVFGDRHLVELGAVAPENVALFVVATVVSARPDGRFVLDAGSKALGRERMSFVEGYGTICGRPDAHIGWLDEHHAIVTGADPPPAPGEMVAIVPNSASYAVALEHEATVVADGEVVDRWPVDASGCLR